MGEYTACNRTIQQLDSKWVYTFSLFLCFLVTSTHNFFCSKTILGNHLAELTWPSSNNTMQARIITFFLVVLLLLKTLQKQKHSRRKEDLECREKRQRCVSGCNLPFSDRQGKTRIWELSSTNSLSHLLPLDPFGSQKQTRFFFDLWKEKSETMETYPALIISVRALQFRSARTLTLSHAQIQRSNFVCVLMQCTSLCDRCRSRNCQGGALCC